MAIHSTEPEIDASFGTSGNHYRPYEENPSALNNTRAKIRRKINLAKGFSQKWGPKPAIASLTRDVSFCDLWRE